MLQKVNEVYKPLFTTDKRYVIIMGGRGAGRSYVASQYATAKLIAPEYFRCAIMRLVLGDIRNSIFQEIRDRIEDQEIEGHVDVRENTLTFAYGENKINGIGFRKSSGDQKSKLKSLASYNCVIIEEADEISEEDFRQLDESLRTLKSDIKIVLLLNPPDKNHWIVKRWCNLIDSDVDGFFKPELKKSITNTVLIHTNYHENLKNLSASSIELYESYRESSPEHYWSIIGGLVSEGLVGRIYKNWKPITSAEFEALPYPSFYGLDFGFKNDPAALIELKRHNSRIYARALIYETGLLNSYLSERMRQIGIDASKPIYADAAEPKSIAEMEEYGWYIMPTDKGQGVRKARTNYTLQYEVFYTEESTSIASEHQTYCWALDKNKLPTNEPQDGNDHAIDAITSAVWTARNKDAPLMYGV